MITEDEAFWAGIAVATMMLGGGFSMLFLHTYTGYGAVVLALGLLTMAITIQMRAKPPELLEVYTPTPVEGIVPTPPMENTNEKKKPSATETKPEPPRNEPPKELAQQTQPPTTEPVAPPQPQAPQPQSVEAPKTEEKPKEEPQVAPPAA